MSKTTIPTKTSTSGDKIKTRAKDNKKASLLILFLVVLIDLIGFGMILPLIPFLGKSTGASPVMVGLLMSIYSVMQFLFSPFWGGISDRFGRKPVLLFSILGAAFSHTAFAFASGYTLLFITRLFAGLFSANISTAMASAADLSTEENRTKTMGLIGAAFGLGFVLGPFLGAQGADLGQSYGFGDQFSSLLAGGLCFLNFIFCIFFFKETLKKKQTSLKINLAKLNPFSVFFTASKTIKNSITLFFAATMALAIVEIVLFYAVKEQFGWGYKKAAYGFAAVGLVMAFTQGGVIRPLKKHFDEIPIILGGGILFSVGLFGAYLFSELWSFGAAILIMSFGYALLNPALNGFISLQASQENQGQTFGVTHGFSALSRICGPILGTYVLGAYTTKTPFLVSSILIAGFLILFSILIEKKNKQ
jgi:MFS family permease